MNNDFLPRRGLKNKHPSAEPYAWARPSTPTAPTAGQAQVYHEQPQTALDENAPQNAAMNSNPPGPKRSFKERLRHFIRTRTKKDWIIIGVAAVILLAGIGYALYALVLKDDPAPVKTAVVKKEQKQVAPPVYYSDLTGVQIPDPAINDRPVTAVMIENSLDARPQAGLADAGIVFEAIAEGGITRFLTLFQDTEPDYIGPVRSVRPYYVQWALGFDAGVAHVGGSADGLALVRNEGKDLDQFFNPGPYHRVSTRIAPHNMYSSIPKLREKQIEKGWTKSEFTPLARKKAGTPLPTPTAKTIDFNISGALYNSHYDYDPATNRYNRSEGGKPHTDERKGQIAADVVIGLVLPQGRNGIYTTYNTIGSGTAFIFQDGGVAQVTWTKTSNKSNFTFKDAAGAEVKLNPGKTWFSVVGGTDRITYAP